jgi:hypothetical protein
MMFNSAATQATSWTMKDLAYYGYYYGTCGSDQEQWRGHIPALFTDANMSLSVDGEVCTAFAADED